ncbi:MAG: Gfo/Idh/MocA family oxidoreductase [Anaerolineae bacterium]|nr:Gfo/Idh/MocA family oxidoreductase [Anaerolineae bacterium]
MTRLIQIGMGGMGGAWLRAIRESDEAEHAAFVEINDDIARSQCQQFGLDPALVFRSLPEAIEAVKADGVVVVTPPQFHREHSVQALRAGLPVLSEKPLADSMEAAREIVRVADETGVLHMVAQNYRYSAPIQTLKSVLDSSRLGEVGAVSVQFFRGPHFGGFRERMPFPLIVDMSIHHFDLMRFLLGLEAVEISGFSFNPSWSWFEGDASALVSLRFAQAEGRGTGADVFVGYHASWCSNGAETPWNGEWRFDCEGGVVTLEQDRVKVYQGSPDGEYVAPVALERTGQAHLLHQFVEALAGGPRPETVCQDNIKSLKIVFDTLTAIGDA